MEKTDRIYITSNIVEVSDAKFNTPSFTPGFPGDYWFELTVIDRHGAESKAKKKIEVYLDRIFKDIMGVNAFATFNPSGLHTMVPAKLDSYVHGYNVGWIEFAPLGWMEDKYSNDVHLLSELEHGGQGYTIDDADLIELIGIFHSKGLKIFLRPTIEFYYWSEWRGGLNPTDWERWFDTYKEFITHYASIAELTEVELFSVGNELWRSEQHTEKWNEIIHSIRTAYSGDITYCEAGIYRRGHSNIEFWPALDLIGIDFAYPITGTALGFDTGYPAISDPPFNIYVDSLKGGIEDILGSLSKQHNMNILITEFECNNKYGGNIYPGEPEPKGALDNLHQVKYYEALMQVISEKPWIKGVFSFHWDLEYDVSYQLTDWPISNSPLHRPASEVIRVWYQSE